MIAADTLAWLDGHGYAVFGYLLGVLWQSSVLLLFVGGLSWVLRKRRAGLRHALWFCAILITPVLPIQESSSAAVQTDMEALDLEVIEGATVLSYVDDSSEGRRSIGGSGHAVRFERPGGSGFVGAVEIFASRYGLRQAPAEDFHLYVLDAEMEVVSDIPYPYGMIARGEMRWYTLRTPSVEVPETFYIALAFNPHQTKGIYLGLDESVAESHSYRGLPRRGFEALDGGSDWMVRVHLADEASGVEGATEAEETPQAEATPEVEGAQRLVDGAAAEPVAPLEDAIALKEERGAAILRKMAEVNKYWLIGPPASVENYAYDHVRGKDAARHFAVDDPRAVDGGTRWGVTYETGLHALASDPGGVMVTEVAEEDGVIRLALRFKETVRTAVGNGLAGSWYGYFNSNVEEGALWLDAEKFVPLELLSGNLRERFSGYVQVDDEHYVPLNIKIDKARPGEEDEGMYFDWAFKLYAPGLWLADTCWYRLGEDAVPAIAAAVSNVSVNAREASGEGTEPVATRVLAENREALEMRAALARGQVYMDSVVGANWAWLMPPLAARRGLVYDYRQEGLYRERIVFDAEGRILAQLESSMEGPETPSRQLLYLPEGVKVTATHGERFVQEERIAGPEGVTGEALLHRERRVHALATGLGWDGALTRMAREPESFLAAREGEDGADTYRLLLQSQNRDTKIFAGTMLAYTSWAYMHDVRYVRSEITIDAGTHQPLEEKDFDGDGKLVASFTFSEYLDDAYGGAPGRIEAVVPYTNEEGEDQALEMDARFRFVAPGVWLLETVHSKFRNSEEGSTGRITLVEARPENVAPVGEVGTRLSATRALLANIAAAPVGPVSIRFQPNETVAAWVRASWGELESEDANICVTALRVEPLAAGSIRVTLDLVSTAYWKEYAVTLGVELRDDRQQVLATHSESVTIQAEGKPGISTAVFDFPEFDYVQTLREVVVTADVDRSTAQYHGHGMWFTFASPRDTARDEGSGKRSWGPEQVIGPPDTQTAGDSPTAWASETEDGQLEWLQLWYAEAVRPSMVRVYETYNPGALFRVSVMGADGAEVEVWAGKDPVAIGSGKGVAEIPLDLDFETRSVKLYFDSPEVAGWNEIDAVGLVDQGGEVQWAVHAEASSTWAQGPAPPAPEVYVSVQE